MYVPVDENDEPVTFYREDLLAVHYFDKLRKIILFTFSHRVFGTPKPVYILIVLPGQEDLEKFLLTWHKVSPQIPKEMETEHLRMLEKENEMLRMISENVEIPSSLTVNKNLLNCFVQFITKNIGMSNEVLKQIIDDIEFLPSFLLSHGRLCLRVRH